MTAPSFRKGARPRLRFSRRGQSMIIVQAIILALLMLISAAQLQTVTQLGGSRSERDFERALQCAEAGLNAYLNRLGNGAGSSTYIPPFQQIPAGSGGGLMTTAEFRTLVENGTISTTASAPYTLVAYPPGSTTSGFYVGHTVAPGAFVQLVSFGYAGGTVRRVWGSGRSFSIFDWAAIWGLNPGTTNQDWAWNFTGSARVVGAAGGEGFFIGSNNVTFYDGPVVWANASYAAPYNNPDPPVLQSSAGVPPGHPDGAIYPEHSHTLASPLYRHYVGKLDFPTADEAANQHSGASGGVAYFKTSNHNATGLRYLVRNTVTGVIRELGGNYVVLAGDNGTSQTNDDDWQLDNELSPNTGTLNSLGMTSEEVFHGVRVYPGYYYFEQVNMTNADRLFLRTFTDAELSIGIDPNRLDRRYHQVVDSSGNEPLNPNPGQAGAHDIRFFIGTTSRQTDPGTVFDVNTVMEYPRYASRFRIYSASRATLTVRGRNQDPPPPFRVNLLAYNKDSNGAGYGRVQFVSATYLFGSLISWMVDVSGGTTIEKEAPELGPDDRLSYVLDYWTELPP